jgi:type IV secretory pathway VirB10-like protein
MIVAFGITAVALCGLDVPAAARAQQGHNEHEAKKAPPQEKDKPTQAKKKQGPDKPQQAQAQQRPHLAPREQQRLTGQQEQRLVPYRDYLEQQQRVAQEQSAQLQQQNRQAQYSYLQQYVEGLHQQRLRIQVQRSDDYGGDPYCYTAPSHRYARAGRYDETNQYGMEVLRQAVNYGYEQGRFAGMADQQDRWPYNHRASHPYQDANDGYGGVYVDRYDYSYYFRQGFRRGYDDGYYGRDHYGTDSDGRVSMEGPILEGILVFEVIR